MTRFLGSVITLALWLVPTSAFARDRLAVFFAADDAELADNLVEVVISELAENRDRELVGQQELRGRLSDISLVHEQGLRACLAQAACLSELAAVAGSQEVLYGTADREGDSFRLVLGISEATGKEIGSPVLRTVSTNVELLLPAVRDATAELVSARRRAAALQAAPAVAVPISPPKNAHLAAPRLPSPAREEPSRSSSRLLSVVGYGTLGLSVVAFSAAAVTGTLARSKPSATTRAGLQEEFDRRETYATTANALFATGGVLAGVSVVTLVWSWK